MGAMVVDSFAERPLSPSIGAFESLKSRPSSSLRRARPPNIVICDENKIPLRPDPRAEKAAKRESKVGLRSIFGRTKSTKTRNGQLEDVDESIAPNDTIKSGATRHWPYSLQASRSDLTLGSMPSLFSSKSNGSSLGLHRRAHDGNSSSKLSSGATSPPADGWIPPPLFQVYPQAIMHSTLPACAASVDALAKLNASHNLLTKEEPIPEEGAEKREEKPKKLHQRHAGARGALEWTTKTYTLVTSGYLLQYAADGHHDRSPEKILRLSKDSAAFASDLIPGKHWVLQVVACMDASTDSRSFISKLALRGTERKFVSTMLMVFERAEDMDSWLAVLRKEIEELGGKKQLTETGEVKSADVDAQLKTQASQRTLVVRDPSRFSTLGSQDFSGLQDGEMQEHDHGLPMIPTSDFNPDLSMDDGSFTESHCSSDGQRLESLRDSRESNTRFSYISSSQRTHGTTANSSPSCSPTRTSFSSNLGQTNQAEVRLRPNSQAISMRRQSVQAVMASFDVQPNFESHPSTSATVNDESNHTPARQSIPNFSKRLSTSSAGSQSAPVVDTQVAPATVLVPLVIEPEPSKSCRKPPPTFGTSRPLSTVMDLPSPRSPLSPSFPPANATLDAPDSPAMFSAWAQREGVPQPQAKHLSPAETRLTAKRLSSSPMPSDARAAPRRFGSLTNLRAAAEDSTDSTNEHPRFILSSSVTSRRERFESLAKGIKEAPRSSSALGVYGSDESSEKPTSKIPSYKRSTMMACPLRAKMEAAPKTKISKPSSPREKPRSPKSKSPSHSPKHLDVDIQAKGLGVRRSMPQLCVGPPLLPPPNRALPPIPQKE